MRLPRTLKLLAFGAILAGAALAQTESDLTSLQTKAQRGNAVAMYNLGLAYANGQGVATDRIEAFVWLSLALENGARGRALEGVTNALSADQRDTARTRLNERRTALGMKLPSARAAAVPVTTPAAPPAPAETPVEKPVHHGENSEAEAPLIPPEVLDLRRALESSDADKKQLSTEVATAWKENEQLKQDLARNQAAAGELARIRVERDALSTKATTLGTQLAAATADRDSARTFGRQVEDTLNKVNDQKATDETNLQNTAKENETLKTRLAANEQQIAAATSTAAGLKHDLEAAQQKPAAPSYPDLSGKVSELEQQLVAAKSAAPAYPDLRNQVAGLEKDLTAARNAAPAYPDLREQVAALEKQVTAAKDAAPAYPDLSGRVHELEAQSATETAALAKAKEELAHTKKVIAPSYPDLSPRVKDLESKLAEAKSAPPPYPDLRSKTQELEATLTENKKSASAAQENARNLSARASELEKQLADAKNAPPAYPDVRGRVKDLEKELAAAKNAAPAYPDLSGKVASLEKELATAKNAPPAYPDLSPRVHELEVALATEKKSAGESATKQHADAEAQLADLRTQVATVGTERARMQAEIARLQPLAEAPKYPDLSGRVKELEAKSATSEQASSQASKDAAARLTQNEQALAAKEHELAEAETALKAASAKPSYPDLHEKVAALESELQAAKSAAPAYPDLHGRVAELEQQVAAAKPAAPAYPDLREKVATLESEIKTARTAAPPYPDLRDKVNALQQQLTTAQAAVKPAGPDLSGKVRDLEAALGAAEQKATAADKARASATSEYNEFKSANLEAQRQSTTLQSQVQMLESEKAALRHQVETDKQNVAQLSDDNATLRRQAATRPDLSGRVKELEAEIAAKPAAPDYPDLREKVVSLETQLNVARTSSPAYPDLREKVAELEKRTAAPQPAAAGYPDLREKVTSLESERQTARNSAPAYPDLRNRVATLEQEIAARRPATAPDNSGHVQELEASLSDTKRQLSDTQIALDALRNKPVDATSTVDVPALQKQFAESEDKLAISLRGYALLEKERDDLAAKSAKATDDSTNATGALTTRAADAESKLAAAQAEVTRLTETNAALQRASAPAVQELAATKALLTQVQNANTTLAQENYQLKSAAAGAPVSRVAVAVPPPARSSASAAPAPASGRVHHVVAGDSLSRISQTYYGTPQRWMEIYRANVDLLGPNGVLRVGTDLRIP